MRGDKIVHARQAAIDLIARMHDGDMVSIYTFADDAVEVIPPMVLNPTTRAAARASLAAIRPSGGTNMHRGLIAALRSANATPSSHPLRRVILISDGRANQGLASPAALGGLAAQQAASGVEVTTLGVGLDYDEHTLAAIAQRSAGRLYHLDDPAQLAAALREEIRSLSGAVATDATIEVTAAPGVTLVGAEGGAAETEPGRLRMHLGDLHGGRHHEVLVRVRAETDAPGSHALAFVRLTCREVTGLRAEHLETLALTYAVTSTAQALRSDGRVQTIVATRAASQLQLRAVDHLNRGDVASADRDLAEAQVQLRAAARPAEPSAAPPPPTAATNVLQQAVAIDAVRTRAHRVAGSHSAARGAALQANDQALRTPAEY
jgi:Ca-activated chloride channel family protein